MSLSAPFSRLRVRLRVCSGSRNFKTTIPALLKANLPSDRHNSRHQVTCHCNACASPASPAAAAAGPKSIVQIASKSNDIGNVQFGIRRSRSPAKRSTDSSGTNLSCRTIGAPFNFSVIRFDPMPFSYGPRMTLHSLAGPIDYMGDCTPTVPEAAAAAAADVAHSTSFPRPVLVSMSKAKFVLCRRDISTGSERRVVGIFGSQHEAETTCRQLEATAGNTRFYWVEERYFIHDSEYSTATAGAKGIPGRQ
mmetsp:Transcript_17273/g.31286  ORF Transcript_17273/g.31286 Transcript_17273/m.31286 type:complete len:250 (-) Transcript_17273:309-1058(-)